MGNSYSTTTSDILYTAAMAKYMTLTKPQVMAIRNTLAPLSNIQGGMVKRNHLMFALKQAEVAESPDQEVLNLLFTMWDMTGTGRVLCAEFIVGVCVLACKEDSIEQALRFALQVADRHRSGQICSKDASTFLRSTL